MMRRTLMLAMAAVVIVSACSKTPEAPTGKAPGQNPSAQGGVVQAPKPVRAKSSPGARVFIAEPANGAAVASPLTVKFGIEGIALEAAGEVKDDSGHHHLLIDQAALPPMDQPLPFSDQLLHFGQAQTEAGVNLAPGMHTLQLVLAGGNHIPHEPPVVSERISITVQ